MKRATNQIIFESVTCHATSENILRNGCKRYNGYPRAAKTLSTARETKVAQSLLDDGGGFLLVVQALATAGKPSTHVAENKV